MLWLNSPSVADIASARPSHIVVCRQDPMPSVTGTSEDSESLLTRFPMLRRLIDTVSEILYE